MHRCIITVFLSLELLLVFGVQLAVVGMKNVLVQKNIFNRMQGGSYLTDIAGKQKEIVHQSGFRAHECRVNSIKRCRMVGRSGKAHPQTMIPNSL